MSNGYAEKFSGVFLDPSKNMYFHCDQYDLHIMLPSLIFHRTPCNKQNSTIYWSDGPSTVIESSAAILKTFWQVSPTTHARDLPILAARDLLRPMRALRANVQPMRSSLRLLSVWTRTGTGPRHEKFKHGNWINRTDNRLIYIQTVLSGIFFRRSRRFGQFSRILAWSLVGFSRQVT